MNAPATPSEKRALLTVFQQHWENARHIKNERLSFTNIYAIVAAGILSLLQNRDGFIDVMRHCISLNGSFFNTQRMVQQYVVKAYMG